MKKLFVAIIAASLLFGATNVNACGEVPCGDCEERTTIIMGHEYDWYDPYYYTVMGFEGDYITARSELNGEIFYYYKGFTHPEAQIEEGNEILVLLHPETKEVMTILEIEI